MRTHLLTDLPIHGKDKVLQILPSFDFYNLRRITRLIWESNITGLDENSSSNLLLTVMYSVPISATTFQVNLKFCGVRQAQIPELIPSLFLSELEIEDK